MAQLREWCFPVAGAVIVAACADSTAPPLGTVAPPPPPAAQLAFTVQPSNAQAGAAITPAVAVAIQDASGKTVTHATSVVTVALGANSGGGPLVGTLSVAVVQGVATFPDLHLDKADTGYRLTAVATGLAGATSALFNITPGPATKLGFAGQPNDAVGGAAITPTVQVAAQDALGNTATAFSGSVTVAIGTNPGGGALGGTVSAPAVNGLTAFSDLHIDKVGTGYTLTAAATGLTGAVSRLFDIVPEPIIVFASSRGIEGIQTDGSGRVVVIADSTVYDAAWSPDGAKLAFTRMTADFHSCEIYTARADGSGAQQITSSLASFPYPRCAYNPSWSPDGTRIAFSVGWGGAGGTFIANVDGSNVRELIADVEPGFFFPGGATWSPDGTQLATEYWGSDMTIFIGIFNADGSWVRDLASAGGCESDPAWSPDGADIAFVGSCEDGGPYTPNGPFGIWLKHPDGSGARNLTDVDFGADESPAWSPDGTQLVYARGYPTDLYIINRDGTGLRQLTSTPDSTETLPAWRPATSAAGPGHLAPRRASVTRRARPGPKP